MQEKTGPTGTTNQNYRGWQSDIIADLIHGFGFP